MTLRGSAISLVLALALAACGETGVQPVDPGGESSSAAMSTSSGSPPSGTSSGSDGAADTTGTDTGTGVRTPDAIVVAPGPDPQQGAIARVLDDSGTPQLEIVDVLGDPSARWGAHVAACDVDGDDIDEIVVGAGAGPGYTPFVRVLARDGSAIGEPIVPSFVLGGARGSAVACGELDGDAAPELVVAPGPDPAAAAELLVLELDGTSIAALQPWGETLRYGASVAVADVDGDGIDEIIAAPGPEPDAGAPVRVLRSDGTELAAFEAFAGETDGAHVAAGDLDGDGLAEIVVAPGPTVIGAPRVRVFAADGSLVAEFSVPATDLHVEHYGYYHIHDDLYGLNLPEVADFTNWAMIRQVQYVPVAAEHGMPAVVGLGFADDETTWPNKVGKYVEDLAGSLEHVEAFIAIDEPELKNPPWDTAKQGRLVDLLHAAFPTIPVAIAYSNKNNVPPDNVDWISINAYMPIGFANDGCDDAAGFAKVVEKLTWAASFGKPVLATMESFEMVSPFLWAMPSLCQERWFLDAVMSEPAVVGMLWFLYPDVESEGQQTLIGVRNRPEYVELHRRMYENVQAGGWGLTLAAGDLDGDGVGEIVVGRGEGGGNAATFTIHAPDGTVKAGPIDAFSGARFGVHVALGRFAAAP